MLPFRVLGIQRFNYSTTSSPPVLSCPISFFILHDIGQDKAGGGRLVYVTQEGGIIMEEMFHSNITSENGRQIKFTESSQLLGDAMLSLVFKVLSLLTLFFITLGIFTNSVNIVVFWRMGFASVSHISFTALSITDLLILVFGANAQIGYGPFFKIDIIIPGNDLVIIANPLYNSVMAMSSWITAIISMERCCCIMLPMKVKKQYSVYSSMQMRRR